jgi:hypothetical protein
VQWKILLDGAYVKPHVKAGLRHGLQFRFTPQEIVSFLNRLQSNTCMLEHADPTLCRISDAARRTNCPTSKILDLLLTGNLQRAFRDPNERGYMAVLVDPEEIRRKAMLPDHGGISLRKVERALKSDTYVVKALVEHGHLPARTAVNPINRCRQTIVMPEDLARFQQTYVSLVNLAEESDQNFNHTKKALEAGGIQPIFDHTAIGARFYLRGAAIRALNQWELNSVHAAQ